MKLFLLLIPLLGCIIATGAQVTPNTTEKQPTNTTAQDTTAKTTAISSTTEILKGVAAVQQLRNIVKPSSFDLSPVNNLFDKIENDIALLSFNLQEQIEQVPQPSSMQLQLTRTSLVSLNQTVKFQQSLYNTTTKVNGKMERTVHNIDLLAREQQLIKDQIKGIKKKIIFFQQELLHSSLDIDNSLLQLTELISRAVLPRLSSLNSSFSSLNISQSDLPQELQNVELVKAVHEVSINKLNFLDLQLAYLNGTQNAQLHKLTEAVMPLSPEQLKVIDKGLQDLVVAQKRIDLKLTIYDKWSAFPAKPKINELKSGSAKRATQINKSTNPNPEPAAEFYRDPPIGTQAKAQISTKHPR
ncbi:uncharacterized protein LOC135440950 [Drosophila montana]|uniref:uncharacterized protein LOC135440950 n=1 Tax=Drosophila montana TaxID=40370 RepID=UPI00313D3675